MTIFDFGDVAALQERRRPATSRRLMRFTASVGALALGSLLAVSPSGGLQAASPAPATCKFAPADQLSRDSAVEPRLIIDGSCIDPDYNESTFVIDKTEQLTFQVPGGPLIPYTQVSGHWPATRTVATLPPGIVQSPITFQQNYVFMFPAKEYWKNRSFLQQHPTGGGQVDRQMAFTNGALTISWRSNSIPNAVATHRHEAAATKWADAYANKLYGNSAHIYNYFWGCSGGGVVSMGAAENTSGVWDGVQVHCAGAGGESLYHAFLWAAHYTMAIPQAKRDAIAAAAVPGGTGDVYAGLNEEEKSVLNEFLAAGYPLPVIGNHFKNFVPIPDDVDIRLRDPTYEDDFWSKPGYAGVNPPNYLKAALVDGWATVTGITRDASGTPTAIQFDPATFPKLGTIGDAYLEYWVYGPDGKTRLIDPKRAEGVPTDNKQRFSVMGKLDPAKALLTLSGTVDQWIGPPLPIANTPFMLNAVKVGAKIRVNNRFILAMYFYPRYSNIPGVRGHDQYRNANGTPKYPQRKDIGVLAHATYRTMGGRIQTGAITSKVMIIEGRGDNLAWPIVNASYAEMVQRTLGKAKANDMMRFYLHDNGRHAVGGGEQGIFYQSLQDMMAWVEKGIAPPPSTAYTIRNGQVVPPDSAAARHGLQPVMSLTVNDVARATVAVNQPVSLEAKFEMPPKTGQIVQYIWAIDGKANPPTVVAKPQTQLTVNRSLSFDKPGTYVVRLSVNGQRDGLVDPANQTLLQNWKEVRVVVQ